VAKRANPMVGLKCFQLAIEKLKLIMAKIEAVQNLLRTLLDGVTAQVGVLLVGLESIIEH
jgi:hypothetical protein